jgi:hypothetical protein
MQEQLPMAAAGSESEGDGTPFYRHVLETLHGCGFPFLVGGAYSFSCCTGISRDTKDLDLFIRRADYEAISAVLAQAGYATEMTFPHWLAKVRSDGDMVDLIFSSGNGIAVVDDLWFKHAIPARVLEVDVLLAPVEETLWSKAFVMERERYDGADVAHLLLARADSLDWPRLLMRFDPHWRLLLSHLILFGFIYPDQRELVPAWVMDTLLQRLAQERQAKQGDGAQADGAQANSAAEPVCGGTLLSREQYLVDIDERGYRDARLLPPGTMSEGDAAQWTEAIAHRDEEEHTQTRIVAGPAQ